MSSHLKIPDQPLFDTFKSEEPGDWPTCQFCFSKFNSRDEWKAHTFSHFDTKKCADCNVHLIQICDEWFELHTAIKCVPSAEHTQNDDHLAADFFDIKTEPTVEVDSQHLEEMFSDEDVFADTFETDFNIDKEDGTSNTLATAKSQHYNTDVQFLDIANPPFTYQVTNVRKIDHTTNVTAPINQLIKFPCRFCDQTFSSRFRHDIHIQSYHDSRCQNSCKHCGNTFKSFERLDKHIRRCTFNNRKRRYLRSHPHRPAADFICDLCGKMLKKFHTLTEHMNEIHSKKYSFKCRICDKRFHSRYYLSKHLNRHKQAFENPSNVAVFGDLDADLMERNKYRRRTEIERKSNLKCDECDREFKHHYSLAEHKSSQHMGQESFQCRKCGRYYTNRYYLTKHMKRHAAAEAAGIPIEELAVDLDYGLMERSRYVRMGPNQDRNASFECNECGETFKKFCYLTQHRRAKHGFDNGFQCKKCGLNVTSRYYLSKHMKRHEQQESEPELNLNFNFINSDEEQSNIKLKKVKKQYVRSHPHQPTTEFICETCDLTFKRYELLREHMTMTHKSEESFLCNQCHNVFPNRYYLCKHMKRHQREQAQEDLKHLDDDLFERKQYFKVHPHRPTSNLVCDICKKTLANYYSLRDHMFSKHLSKKKRSKLTCSKCKSIFLSKHRLEMHCIAMHSNNPILIDESKSKVEEKKIEEKQMCSTCGRLFPDRTKLKEHEETHLGIMTACEICGKQFIHKNYLRKHVRNVHTKTNKNERRFKCKIDGCEWTFAYQQCLIRHRARRHGIVKNRNACPICGKEFPESTYHLNRHLKAHANNTAKEYIPEQKPASEAAVS